MKRYLTASVLGLQLMGLTLFVPTISYAADPPATTQTVNTSITETPAANTQNTQYVPLTQLPGLSGIADSTTLPTFFNYLYKICIGAAAVIAVLEIMIAGVEFMTSRGSVSSNEKAKSRIQNAVLGLVLVLSPTIFFGIINPSILNLDFTKDVANLKPAALTPQSTAPTGTTATANACGSGPAKIALGTAANACTTAGAGYTSVATSCCQASGITGNTCCGLTAAQKYQLAGYYTKENKTTKYKCYVSIVGQFGSTNECNAAIKADQSSLSAQSSDTTTFGSLVLVRSCVATTDTSYTLPAPDNLPLCPN